MARKIHRKRKFDRAALVFGLGLLVYGAMRSYHALVVRLGRTPARLLVVALIVLFVSFRIARFIRGVRRRWTIKRQITVLALVDQRGAYLIENSDYRRGTPKESHYRKVMALELIGAFGNACAKCGARDNGLDLDHFFMSKNEGGTFLMRHRDGYLVNNAIPLCQTCNRRKSDHSYKAFFTPEELVRILALNARMTDLINQRELLDLDGAVVPTGRVRRAS